MTEEEKEVGRLKATEAGEHFTNKYDYLKNQPVCASLTEGVSYFMRMTPPKVLYFLNT